MSDVVSAPFVVHVISEKRLKLFGAVSYDVRREHILFNELPGRTPSDPLLRLDSLFFVMNVVMSDWTRRGEALSTISERVLFPFLRSTDSASFLTPGGVLDCSTDSNSVALCSPTKKAFRRI